MRVFLFLILTFAVACHQGVDEELVAKRLDENNELLEKQVNLLRKQLILELAGDNTSPAKTLFEQSEQWLLETEKELEDYQTAEQSAALLRALTNRFNDSMKQYSTLFVEWKPEPIHSERTDLLRSWKRNNFLVLSLIITEKCLSLHEVKSLDASSSLRPVIYSSQFYQVQKGKNAIFDIAFKSRKPELVEIRIDKALLNGNEIALEEIDIDRYTQRFILLSLEKGQYSISGVLIMINEKGEKEYFPFEESFRVD